MWEREEEERQLKLEILRKHLAKGEGQALRGEFTTETFDEMIAKFEQEQND